MTTEPVKTFFSAIYSVSFFDHERTNFFTSANYFADLNLRLLARLYSFVIAFALILNIMIWYYGRLRHRLQHHPRLKKVLAVIVLPRISEWHVILSPMLLPNRGLRVRIDVLTKAGILYEGDLRDKMLSANGDLQSITLKKPRRFRREQFAEARKADAD